MNNNQVGHAWYYDGNRTNGDTPKNKNFYYNGDTIYSYGSHYPIAKKVFNTKLQDHILMTVDATWWPTCASYGPATSKHVSITRHAIPSNTTIIYVEQVDAMSKQDHQLNYKAEMHRIKSILKMVSTGRNGSGAQNDRISAINQIATGMNLYTKAYKLGKKQIDISELFKPETLAKLRATEKRVAAKKKRAKIAADLRAIEQAKETIEQWKSGANVHMPYSVKKVYLRIKDTVIQTSQGAVMEIKHAKKLFSFVCNVCQKKESFKPRHFGPFELLKVDDNCTIKIGCHVIEMDEMERVNAML